MKDHGFSTRAIHTTRPAARIPSEPVASPIVQTASFAFDGIEALSELIGQPGAGFGYSRASNPTVDELERSIAALEGAGAAVAFSAGVAAIHAVAVTLCQPGDHIVAQRALYGGSQAVFSGVLARLGIETTYVPYDDLEAWRRALRPTTRLLFAETLGNPSLVVPDLPALAELARAHGAKLAVDATFSTPYLCRPLEWGADLVIHSATKYLGGHGDLIAGLAAGDEETIGRVRATQILTGSAPAPFVAWLVLRGLKTLALRMRQHVASAAAVAAFLAARPEVARVYHPSLRSHPEHARAAARMPRGSTGVVSFEVHGGREDAVRLVDRLELFTVAGSLGDAHSLVTIPSLVSHKHVPDEELEAAGIPARLIRLSVGLEDPEDLVGALGRALERR